MPFFSAIRISQFQMQSMLPVKTAANVSQQLRRLSRRARAAGLEWIRDFAGTRLQASWDERLDFCMIFAPWPEWYLLNGVDGWPKPCKSRKQSFEKVRFILITAAQPRSETRWTQRFLFKIHFRTLRSSWLCGESHCWENMSKDGLKFVPFQAGPIYLTQ